MHNTETTLFTNVIVFAFQICNERNSRIFCSKNQCALVGILISVGDVSMSIATCCIIQTTMPLQFHRNENNNPTS